ncbi:MAG: hypothetical protein DI546_01135, partial [Rhizobium sp.]
MRHPRDTEEEAVNDDPLQILEPKLAMMRHPRDTEEVAVNDDPLQILKTVYGYDSFRGRQAEI